MEEGEGSETGHLASSAEQESSLKCIQDIMIDAKMLNSVPALKLFASKLMKQHREVGVASNQAPPTSTSHTASLEAHRETVVYSLHLVYEVCTCMYFFLNVCY